MLPKSLNYIDVENESAEAGDGAEEDGGERDLSEIDSRRLDGQDFIVVGESAIDDAGGEEGRGRQRVGHRIGDQERDNFEDLSRAETLLRRLGEDAAQEDHAGEPDPAEEEDAE